MESNVSISSVSASYQMFDNQIGVVAAVCVWCELFNFHLSFSDLIDKSFFINVVEFCI